MDKVTIKILRKLRKFHSRMYPASHKMARPEVDFKGQQANDQIRNLLGKNQPCMVSRIGGTEIPVIVNHIDITAPLPFFQKATEFINGKRDRFWWDPKVKSDMRDFSGFFSNTEELLTKYSIETLNDLKFIDILGSWLKEENRVAEYFSPSLIRIPLVDLEPYHFQNPWSELLAGKKVLVVHPFEESIKSQYAKHKLLFKDPAVLPEFELKTLKSVQSLVGNQVPFPDWFAALDWMCQQMEKIDFDITVIGAGAYGLPLAAHAKRMGKMAVHLGAATQMLFGIRGKRWDEYPEFHYLFNEHWVRPQPQETPQNFRNLEAGAYW